jgi:hypothetical protein
MPVLLPPLNACRGSKPGSYLPKSSMQDNWAQAERWCQEKSKPFATAGAVVRYVSVPKQGEVIAVIECVKKGWLPRTKDARNNIGCWNTGERHMCGGTVYRAGCQALLAVAFQHCHGPGRSVHHVLLQLAFRLAVLPACALWALPWVGCQRGAGKHARGGALRQDRLPCHWWPLTSLPLESCAGAGSDNFGSYNTGSGNNGNYNTGSNNTGDRNSGSFSVGNRNSGCHLMLQNGKSGGC